MFLHYFQFSLRRKDLSALDRNFIWGKINNFPLSFSFVYFRYAMNVTFSSSMVTIFNNKSDLSTVL